MTSILRMSSVALTSILIASLLSTTTTGQVRDGWKAAKGPGGLYFEVPNEFETTRGTGPGFIANTSFTLQYVSARNTRQGMFVSANTGIIQLAQNFDQDTLDELAEQSLAQIIAPLSVPHIGVFTCNPDKFKTSEYKALDSYVRETDAISQATGREYRVYLTLSLKKEGFRKARLIILVAGGPSENIKDINRTLSTILASFKLE
jgi:hypothetical protein